MAEMSLCLNASLVQLIVETASCFVHFSAPSALAQDLADDA